MAKLSITDSEIIKSGERELLDNIIGDLDWEAVEKIVKEKHRLRIQDDVEFKQGDLVVHNDSVAYRLDFDVKVTLTLLCDRSGNYLSFSTSGDFSDTETDSVADFTEPDIELETEAPEGHPEIPDDPDASGDLLAVPPEETTPEIRYTENDDIGFDSGFPEPDTESEAEASEERSVMADVPDALLAEAIEEAAPADLDVDTGFSSEPEKDRMPAADPQKSPDENISDMANQIEEMLSEIDEEENNV